MYPDDTCRAVFRFTLPNGELGFVTPHFQTMDASSFDVAALTLLGNQLEDWALNDNFDTATNFSLMNSLSDQITLDSITLTGLAPVLPPQHVNTVVMPGIDTAPPLPNETALVVTWYTGIVGRSYRGRSFWPGLSTSIMDDDGTLITARLSNFQDTFDALRDGLENIGDFQVVVNSNLIPTASKVLSCVVRDTLHHQRRRNN